MTGTVTQLAPKHSALALTQKGEAAVRQNDRTCLAQATGCLLAAIGFYDAARDHEMADAVRELLHSRRGTDGEAS